MRRRSLLLGALLFTIRAPLAAQTTQYRIAYLTGYSAAVDEPLFAALKQGLRDLGYVEGKNIVFDVRRADGRSERVAALAGELLAFRPDVFVVATDGAAVEAARLVPRATPIVLANSQDPITAGLVKNLARPGGNITGMSDFHAASVTKRLQLTKEAVDSLKIVGVLWNPDSSTNEIQLKDLQNAAPALALKLVSLPARNWNDIERGLRELDGHAGNTALMLLGNFVLTTNMARIAKHAIEHRIPAVYTTHRWTEVGGFMAYGTNFEDLYRRSAGYVDKILRGAKPGDLAIEQPTKFDLIVNLRTARAIGVRVPSALLVRADRVID